VPIPAFSSALAYYDGYRSERLPANLLQAQRDYFGAHTYERTISRAASSSTPTGRGSNRKTFADKRKRQTEKQA
jgi:6-phosphogluconate dehydrogenase